jgi:5-methylcytosine-specific restriction protein A
MRMVWVFPLRLLAGQPLHLEEKKTQALFLNRISRRNRQLTDTQLKQIEHKPRTVQVPTHTAERVIYSRDPDIVLYALRRANGFCELCEQRAPFNNREGLPFLEVHHIVYLSRGGYDTIDNVAALCPNCHRRMHILEQRADIKRLTKKALQLVSISASINSN